MHSDVPALLTQGTTAEVAARASELTFLPPCSPAPPPPSVAQRGMNRLFADMTPELSWWRQNFVSDPLHLCGRHRKPRNQRSRPSAVSRPHRHALQSMRNLHAGAEHPPSSARVE